MRTWKLHSQDLLELSTRSRLLHTPRKNVRSGILEIVDEHSDHVFRLLVGNGRPFTFLAAQETDEAADPSFSSRSSPHPTVEEVDENGIPLRYVDTKLQTQLVADALDRRLLRIFYDARTVEEEQGVNILYLALGFLKWFESDSSETERFAPLVLVPVNLERQSARSRFVLRYTEEEITLNLSLQAKLKAEFGLDLPDLPEAEELIPSFYYRQVERAVSGMKRWGVVPDAIVLGLFSFAKFLMYRDLDPQNWPPDCPLESAGVVQPLLDGNFEGNAALDGDEHSIDALIPVETMAHIRDADSSQTLAIEQVRRGSHLVIQGPPGTGKSQTIANIIAAAVKERKKVLFVAEKMAALEVVQRRLEEVGLGPICLELHSHKAKKGAVLEELKETLDLGAPTGGDGQALVRELGAARTRLNDHVRRMHAPIGPSEWTPYQILGELVRLRGAGIVSDGFQLPGCEQWTKPDLRATRPIGRRCQTWRSYWDTGKFSLAWSRHHTILPGDVQRLSRRWDELIRRLDQLSTVATSVAVSLSGQIEMTLGHIQKLARLGLHLATAPEMDQSRLADTVWVDRQFEIDRIVALGKELLQVIGVLSGKVADVAWTTDVAATRRNLAAYGRSWFRWWNRNYRRAQAELSGILTGPPPKPLNERLSLLDVLIRGQKSKAVIAGSDDIGRRAFGTRWRQESSDWGQLSAITNWVVEGGKQGLPRKYHALLPRIADPQGLRTEGSIPRRRSPGS